MQDIYQQIVTGMVMGLLLLLLLMMMMMESQVGPTLFVECEIESS